MMFVFWDIIVALFNAVTSFFTANYFFSTFSTRNKKNSLYTLLAFIVFIFYPLFTTNAYINMVVLASCVFVISLSYEFKLYNKILFTFLFLALNVVVEIIAVIIITYLFSVDAATAMSGVFVIYGALFTKFVCIILFYLIGTIKRKILIGQFKTTWISIYVLPVATFFVTYALYRAMFYYENDVFLKNLSLASLVLLIISNMLIFKLVDNIRDAVMNENRLIVAEELVRQQEKQYRLLLENNDVIVKLRHDHKNFVVGLLAILRDNSQNENLRLIDLLEEELRLINKSSYDNVCGDSVLDSIINFKILEAKDKSININFNHRNLQNIGIWGVDLAILIGNALDNAIEAVDKLENKNEAIELSVYGKGSQTIITIMNKVCEDIDVENLQSKKGMLHGYGVMNMKLIVAKYDGTITFSCEKKIFTTIIILNNKQHVRALNGQMS